MHIIKRADGGVSIIDLVDGSDVGEEFAKWESTADPTWLPATVEEINPASIPKDRTFRDAWTHGDGIVVDMPKAQEVVRERLRAARVEKLAALDVELLRAIESKDKAKQTEVTVRKQELRDLPSDPRITESTTPEGLSAVMVELLAQVQ